MGSLLFGFFSPFFFFDTMIPSTAGAARARLLSDVYFGFRLASPLACPLPWRLDRAFLVCLSVFRLCLVLESDTALCASSRVSGGGRRAARSVATPHRRPPFLRAPRPGI